MENKNKIKKSFSKILIIFTLVFLLGGYLNIPVAKAATLYFSPSTATHNVGSSFNFNVYVASADQAMNAASGTISFPSDKLEVTAVSTSGSIVSLWVQEPSYSNSAGTVSFEGIVLNPGWQGGNGKVLSVSFRTKAPGEANITFGSGSILANDGQGTNILSGLGSARINIEVPVSGPVTEEAETPAVITGTPPAPRIVSETHPDPDSWYNNNIPIFSWDLSAGTDAVRLLVGDKPQASPTVDYLSAISSKQLEDMDDGVWYFHVRLHNSAGWGGVTHFGFQIDTQNPEFFNMELLPVDDPTTPTRQFTFEASDLTSGISHYEIQVDGGDAIEWEDDGSHLYETSVLGPGKHNLIIRSVDKAGNFLTNFAEFIIDPLEAPTLTEYPKELQSKDAFLVRGTTYPSSQVILWLQREKDLPRSYFVKSDDNGDFTYIHEEKLKDSVYTMWAEVIDQRGARSKATQKYTIVVQQPQWWKIGTFTVDVLSILIPLIALIFLLVGVVWFSWFKLRMLQKRVKTESAEAQAVVHKEFRLLKRRMRTHITLLEKTGKKRKLTIAEEKVVKQLRKDLDYVEDRIAKEIKDIQKEVK